MSKIRNLPETTTLADADLLYAVDESAGPNGGRKITKANLKTSVAQSAAEIKTAYESNPDTNDFTDAEKSKLAGIEAGAMADQNAAEVPYDNSTSAFAATNVQDALDEVNTKAQADFIPSIVSGRILHYSGGTARFDGVFYQLAAGDILLNPSITNGELYLDLDGIVKQTSSSVDAPPFTIVIARFSTDLDDITSLTDERVKNSQNIIRGLLADIRDVRAGAAASAGTSGRVSDAMHKHNILTAAASTQIPDQANAEGSSTSLARADHTHDIPTAAPIQANADGSNTQGSAATFALSDHKHDILTGTPATQNPDQSNAAGSSSALAKADHVHNIPADAPTTNLSPATTNAEGIGTSFARNDHTHALDMAQTGDFSTVNAGDDEALGTADRLARADHQHPVSTAVASSLTTTSTDTEGSATSLARSDHTHAIASAAPVTQNPDQANAIGSSSSFAKADHVHNIPADAPTTNLTPSTTNAEGVGTSFARNDHTHAIATAIAGDLSTVNAGDAASAGTAANYARGDHQHPVATATPSTQNPDQSNAEGTSTSLARADHIHNIPADAPTTALAPSSTNTEGTGTSFARNDHTHALSMSQAGDLSTINAGDAEVLGVADRISRAGHQHPVATAAAVSLTPATTNAEGSSTSLARADHTHVVATALVGDITMIQPDDAAAAGTASTFARGDHKHAIVAAAASSVSTTTTNTEGSSTSFARADHTHAVTVTNSEVTQTTDDTTTSATDTLMVTMTSTPVAGTYLVMWDGSIVNSANGAERTFVSLYLNGSQVSATERSIGTSGGAYQASSTHAVITTPGSQAIELRWRVAGGTSTVHSRRLTFIKLA